MIEINNSQISINLYDPFDENAFLEAVKVNPIDTICIDKDWGDDVDFMAPVGEGENRTVLEKFRSITTDLKFLEKIEDKSKIKAIQSKVELTYPEAITVLYGFKELQELLLSKSIAAGNDVVDVSNWQKLKRLTTSQNIDIVGLEKIHLESFRILDNKKLRVDNWGATIKELYFRADKPVRISDFKDLRDLNKLTITQASMVSLSGIENLRNLQELQINYCTKLTDISALRECLNLKILEFTACKQIKDFTPLSQLNNLEKLRLFNCGEIPSLKFIESMENLKFLSFANTNVLDGDLTPCMRLKYAWTIDKRHYNIKAKDLPNIYNS